MKDKTDLEIGKKAENKSFQMRDAGATRPSHGKGRTKRKEEVEEASENEHKMARRTRTGSISTTGVGSSIGWSASTTTGRLWFKPSRPT